MGTDEARAERMTPLERDVREGEARREAEIRLDERRKVLAELRAGLAELELHDDLPDSYDRGYMGCWRDVEKLAASLLAPEGEGAATRHFPRRDDAVARWLRERREQCRDVEFFCIDRLLNEYREKADYGLALDQEGGDPL